MAILVYYYDHIVIVRRSRFLNLYFIKKLTLVACAKIEFDTNPNVTQLMILCDTIYDRRS